MRVSQNYEASGVPGDKMDHTLIQPYSYIAIWLYEGVPKLCGIRRAGGQN